MDTQQAASSGGDDPQWSELMVRYDMLQAAARLAWEALLAAYKTGADGSIGPPPGERSAIGTSARCAWPPSRRCWLTSRRTYHLHLSDPSRSAHFRLLLHHFHHAHNRGNYGLYFTWWDRWCGTEDAQYLRDGDARFAGQRVAGSAR